MPLSQTERFSDLRVLRWAERIKAALEWPAGASNQGPDQPRFHRGQRRGDTVQPGPIRCNLDLTNLCSHHCYFCEPAEYRAETVRDRRHTLETARALEVLDDLKALDCKTVNFSGGGEPTLHPDFGTVLERAAELGFRTWVVTHGGHMNRWLPALVRADHVRVSLDASNEDEHNYMHGARRGEFGRVVENIRALSKSRKVQGSKSRKPEIGIAYILTDCNSSSGSLRRVCDLAVELEVDFIHFRPISEGPGSAKTFTGDWEALAAQCEALQGEYPGVQVFPLGKRWKDVFYQREFAKCYAALTLAVVGANGDVQACCDRRDIVFGNVHERRFREIWLDAQHRARAEAIVPKLCSRCLMCGTNRAIEQFVVRDQTLAGLL